MIQLYVLFQTSEQRLMLLSYKSTFSGLVMSLLTDMNTHMCMMIMVVVM